MPVWCQPALCARARVRWRRPRRYFIAQDGSLDVAGMRAAAALLVGEHDFRHFCKARSTLAPRWTGAPA